MVKDSCTDNESKIIFFLSKLCYNIFLFIGLCLFVANYTLGLQEAKSTTAAVGVAV